MVSFLVYKKRVRNQAETKFDKKNKLGKCTYKDCP